MKREWLLALVVLFAQTLAASPSHSTWVSTKIGPFVVYSDNGAKEVRERAAEIEQFRFSLGELLGRPDLTIRPPLEIFFTRALPAGRVVTRTGAIAMCVPGPLTPDARRTLAQILLTTNIGRMPAGLEHGLESFLSTTEVHGAKVVWGNPPPVSDRDADWALVEWLVTNGASYGQFRVLLANLEKNVDEDVAFRNAIGKKPADVRSEVNAFLRAGVFHTIDGPSRALSVARDFVVKEVDPPDMNLRLADLLLPDAASRYREVLNTGTHKAEAEEGLALLAARAGDAKGAAELLTQAMADGSKNAAALIEYARIEPDAAKSRAALEQAVTADPNSAEARFRLGTALTDPTKRYEQYSVATKLAPREQAYWVALANVLMELKQWAAAAKAWRGAEQAAVTPEEREKMMAQRLAIESQRLDDEEAVRKQAEEARVAEINRLKQQAIAELRAAEARVNQGSTADANAVPWDQINPPTVHVDGQMVRIDCVGKTMRLVLKTADGKLLKFNMDRKNIAFRNQTMALTCGTQSQFAGVDYVAATNSRQGLAGDVSVIDLR